MLGAKQALDKAGIRWRTEKRGLDHGVWGEWAECTEGAREY